MTHRYDDDAAVGSEDFGKLCTPLSAALAARLKDKIGAKSLLRSMDSIDSFVVDWWTGDGDDDDDPRISWG